MFKKEMACQSIVALQKRTFGDLRWLEIVFIFPRLVWQILFQIQFGLSYQGEIYYGNKWNVVESFHHIFSRKPVTMATI